MKTAKKIMSFIVIIAIVFSTVFGIEFKAFATTKTEYLDSETDNTDIKRQVKVLVLEINPTLEHPTGGTFGNGMRTITTDNYLRFDASKSISFLEENIEEVSHGNVEVDIVERIYINEFPKYTDGESLTQKDFFEIYPIHSDGYGDWYEGVTSDKIKEFPDNFSFDYERFIDDYNLAERRNNGDFDMVWIFGNDPMSLYEACMVGKKPFYINGGMYIRDCDNFPILTMTFARKDGSLEDLGHVAECILTNVFQSGEIYSTKLDGTDLSKLTTWEKFVLCKGNATDETTVYGVGNVHYSPNSTSDYDWANQTAVKSYWKDFENGNLSDIGSTVADFTAGIAYQSNKYNIGEGNTISHHRWWFSCMPHTVGRDENGFSNNWWDYIFTADYVNTISFIQGENQTELILGTGESKQLSLLLNYFSGNQKQVSLKDLGAVVSVEDSDVIAYENGEITALKVGTTTITVKYDGRVAKLNVNVTGALSINNVTIDLGTTFNYGQTANINASAVGGDGTYTYSAYVVCDYHGYEELNPGDDNGSFTWTPKVISDGYIVCVNVTDASGASASRLIDVSVTVPDENMLTIYYENENWSDAYIHYRSQNGSWTAVPGYRMLVASEKSGYKWKYTINLAKDNSQYAIVCFNNGNNSWDSKNGANYTIGSGIFGVKGEKVETLIKDVSVTAFNVSSQVGGTNNKIYLNVEAANGIEPYTYEYFYVLNGKEKYITKTVASETYWIPYEEGTYTLKVKVTDGLGKTAEKTIESYVVEGAKISEFITYRTSPEEVGTVIGLEAKVTNIREDKYDSYSFFVEKDGIETELKTTGKKVAWIPKEAGTYTLKFEYRNYLGTIVLSESITYEVTE